MFERIPPRERRDLLIAWLAISAAFTLIFVRSRVDLSIALIYFLISLLTVGVGFVLHEMAHKFAAMHFGYWAEFQRDDQMLLVAVVLAALAGVVFAAPGATVVYGTSVSKRENGIISAAGPVMSLLLCIPFALLALFGGQWFLVGVIGLFGLKVNAMLAAFNMLPVSVLDGRKVLAWNPAIFAVLIAGAFGLLYLTYLI
ncbi:zinc metalloprotease [Methanosphaerula palustris]|uniref:Peptidase M50 n=1 Tax=Methanosphaerula palustris (strain ATCC BAA-1556 / DSM 19958 / E1-9c) TaxID=521011 RepID=B8GKZ4_METPE|nr:peptidase M50 [Methanosphaerula palustris]ACL17290.1 peptidase M50 [Methanosphaerula palustris E1-9c]